MLPENCKSFDFPIIELIFEMHLNMIYYRLSKRTDDYQETYAFGLIVANLLLFSKNIKKNQKKLF